MTATYRNPWHLKGRPEYGPAEYATAARAATYRGYLIYHRNAECFDVVKEQVCVAQRGGMKGAQCAVDALILAESGVATGVRNCGTCEKTYTCVRCDHESQQQLFDLSCTDHVMRAIAPGGAA